MRLSCVYVYSFPSILLFGPYAQMEFTFFVLLFFFCPVSESKPSAPFISIPPPQLAASPLKRVTPLPPDVMRGDSGGRVVLGAGSHHLDKKPPPREAGGASAHLRRSECTESWGFFVPSSCIFQGVK